MDEIRAVLFDAGGTLVDLDADRICDLLEEEFSVEPDRSGFRLAQRLAARQVELLVESEGASTEQLGQRFYSALLAQVCIGVPALEAAVEAVWSLARREMLWTSPADSAPGALDLLRARGIRLAVVSNSDGRVEGALAKAGLSGHFEFVVDSQVVGVEKPDPYIFQIAMDRLGIEPQRAIYVGDLYSVDVVGSRRAGLIPVLFDPFGLRGAADCHCISRLDELVTLCRPD